MMLGPAGIWTSQLDFTNADDLRTALLSGASGGFQPGQSQPQAR